jgi:hypothetical protein
VQQIFVGGEPLDPARAYTAAFVTEQGVGPKYGTNRQDTGVSTLEALERVFAQRGAVRAELEGTVTLV